MSARAKMEVPAEFVVLVPSNGKKTSIVRGSGIVAPANEWHAFQRGEAESVLIHYEGNTLGAENLRLFHERVYHAAGRAVERYPTVARRAVFDRSEFTVIGTFLYGPKGPPGPRALHGMLTVQDEASANEWLASGRAVLTEDGYVFVELQDLSWADSYDPRTTDLSFESLAAVEAEVSVQVYATRAEAEAARKGKQQ